VTGPFGSQNLLQAPSQFCLLSEHQPSNCVLQFLKSLVQQASGEGVLGCATGEGTGAGGVGQVGVVGGGATGAVGVGGASA